MSRTAAALVTAIVLVSGAAAHAETLPEPGSVDARVRVVAYDDRQVYRLPGVFRTATQVIFGEGETISSVALGDTSSWEVAPADNMLFVKPKQSAGPTNLLVVTKTGDGTPRTYSFALSARAGDIHERTGAVFQVKFRYPREEAAARAVSAQRQVFAEAMSVEAKAVKLALDAAVLQGERNLKYVIAGSPDLAPSEVTDNGSFTVLRFPNNQGIPAIFSVGPDGSEEVVAYDVRGDFVVIHGVLKQLRLRRGRTLACIWNDAFDRYGPDKASDTASPDVERVIERAGADE